MGNWHGNQKLCYCVTCDRDLHYLGVPSHRTGHLNRGESCKIMYTDGTTKTHKPQARHIEHKNQKEPS
jgi:hypothetical protein